MPVDLCRTTRALSAKGATVYILSRTAAKVEDAIKQLEAQQPGVKERLHHVQLDLLDLKGCRKAAKELSEKTSRLDGIILNAGIMASPYKLTELDGIEEQFQVDHLSQFALTRDLIPLLQQTAQKTGQDSRVVVLASVAHRFVKPLLPWVTPRFGSLKDVNRALNPLCVQPEVEPDGSAATGRGTQSPRRRTSSSPAS